MKLGEALRLLSKKKAELVRKLGLRESLFYYKKGETPEKTFADLTAEIDIIVKEIRSLKKQIDFVNSVVSFKYNYETHSILDLIIRIGDIKSELKQLSLLQKPKRYLFDKEDSDSLPQISQIELHNRIEELERLKDDYDQKLQYINWHVDISKIPFTTHQVELD